MNAEIKNGKLIITIEMEPKPVLSASGKTFVIASSRGNITTTAVVNGKPVVIGLNAYIKRDGAPMPEPEAEVSAGRLAVK